MWGRGEPPSRLSHQVGSGNLGVIPEVEPFGTITAARLTCRIEHDNMSITEYASRFPPQTFFIHFCASEDSVRNLLSSTVSRLVVAAVLLPLAGCIAHAPGSGGGGTGTTTVTLSPDTATTLSGGSTLTFTATVKGPELTGVNWYVNGIQNGNPTIGQFTPGSTAGQAVYTAPSTVPNPATVSITAQAIADGTLSKPPVPITITKSTVAVSITPTTANVDAGATQTFTATVTGTTNVAVNWFVDQTILNGNSTVGTITATSTSTGSSAVYTAPTPAPSVAANPTITAVAVADSGASATATVTVPPIVVTLSPSLAVYVPVSGKQTFTATVTGTTNLTVNNWQVNNIVGGSPTYGTIVSTGPASALYTAPPTIGTAPFPITISAASAADSTAVGQVQGDVHVIVNITPATNTIGQGANRQFTAVVIGATNQAVNWLATCGNCQGTQSGGKFDVNVLNAGLYYAPGFGNGTTEVTDNLTARSQFDSLANPGMATVTVLPSDPLGKATPSTAPAAEISCPAFTGGLSGATCYQVTVSCDGITDASAYLKVNTPAGTPNAGTVIFGTANGGTTLYDNDPIFIASDNGGESVVQGVLAPFMSEGVSYAGFTTVQISFGGPFDSSASANGWLQGPGGVRRLACRYATVADWIYKNINNSSTSVPMCATGHREGAGALGYAVSQYGLASEFALIEQTSGPAMTRLHWGCNLCGQPYVYSNPCTQTSGVNMCYSGTDSSLDITAGTIDAAYQAAGQTTPTLCTNGLNGDNTNYGRFQSDSIEGDSGVSPPLPIPNPPTNVKVLLGMKDTGTAALPQGYAWWGAVGPQPLADWLPAPAQCPADWPQAIPSVPDGATQIVNDIQTMCKVN